MLMLVRRGYEGFRPKMAAMAGAAGDRRAGVVDLADVVPVDILGHGEHQAGGCLLRLRVVGVFQARAAIGAEVVRVRRMAGAAMCAQRGLPLLHDLVNLFAAQGFGQNFEVGGRGMRVLVYFALRSAG